MNENNKGRAAGMVDGLGLADTAAVLVYATFPGREAALEAGKALIESRIAACINILPQMTSIYRWQGEIETAEEAVMIAKLAPERVEDAVAQIEAAHPYDTPAILVIPVLAGASRYLDWIRSETVAGAGTT
jgi:periplasmic divalent cation tolerance protein